MSGRMARVALTLSLIAAIAAAVPAPDSAALVAGNDYRDAVLADGPATYWQLGETSGSVAVDTTGALDGQYRGSPALGQAGLTLDANSAAAFDGVDDSIAIPDSTLINLGVHTERTVEAWFVASDVTGRQVIYEEGGASRGLAIYIDSGSLYGAGWNTANDSSPDTPWGPVFLSTPVTASAVYHVVLVLDQAAASLTGYLNGVEFGTGAAGTLHAHGADIGIAAMNNAAHFHDGAASGDGYFFEGVVDEVAVYNKALSASSVAGHYAVGLAPPTAPSAQFVTPVDGSQVAGPVTVEVAASDPQEPAAALEVSISTDGGSTFVPADFNPGPDTHSVDWDTTLDADGAYSIVAMVLDGDGNSASSTITVAVSNSPTTTGYRDAVVADDPAVYYRLGEVGGTTALDHMSALDAAYVGAPLLGGPGLVADGDAAPHFAGGSYVAVPDSSLINLSHRNQRTIEAWIRPDEVDTRAVIFEEGAGTRGMSLYVDGGLLYMGAWNLSGQSWGPHFFSAPIVAGETYHVVLVLDDPRLEGFVNGGSIGSTIDAGRLLKHTGDVGVAAMNDSTRFHDGAASGTGMQFRGVIDEVAVYNAALDATAVAHHYAAGGAEPQVPTASFVVPMAGATLTGTVLVQIAASDPQTAAELLSVDVSTDGGASFAPAAFDPAGGLFEYEWDTTMRSDGPASLLATVSDPDFNSSQAAVDVFIDNAVGESYRDAVLASGPAVYWRLGEAAGNNAFDLVGGVDGTYTGGPALGQPGLVVDPNTAVRFDGGNDYVAIPDSDLINLGTRTRRSVSVWFSPEDADSRQVVFDEGGVTRGLSMYVLAGEVHIGAWNTLDDSSSDTPWGPIFFSAPIAVGNTYNAVAVLDQPNGTFTAYLNGVAIGSGIGGTLHGHGSDTGIGAMNNATRFADSSDTGNGHYFAGTIDEVAIYNIALDAMTVDDLYLIGAAQATSPSATFVNPLNGAIVSGSVTIEVSATDPQDPPSALGVDISTDGGTTFQLAAFDEPSQHHMLQWDTTGSVDGPVSLVVRVVDGDGNEVLRSIDVTVSNIGATHMIVAAGDISTCDNTNDTDTASLVSTIVAGTTLPVTVVPVGDLVYDGATDEAFANCYDPTWGQHKAISSPVIGNHEYNSPGASGYFNYWGGAAAPPDGWYRYEIAGWEVFALNSVCGSIGGCGAESPQVQWLRTELAASSNACTLAFHHHPRFDDETPSGNLEEFWKALHDFDADVVVAAHAHYYAESALQDWQGNLDPTGIRQFIAGTGGRSLHALPTTPHPNQEVLDNTNYGVLVLELAAGAYSWQFRRVGDGAILHSGTATCN